MTRSPLAIQRHSFGILFLLALLVTVGTSPAFAGHVTWQLETVDTDSVSGRVRMVLDNGEPRVVYSANPIGPAPKELRLASWSGGIWTVETIEVGDAGVPDIAIDSSGVIGVTYANSSINEVRYASKSGGIWTIETVATTVGASRQTIAFDVLNAPHIAYGDLNPGDAVYARKVAGVWTTEVAVPGLFFSGLLPEIAIDAAGVPSFSYRDALTDELILASRSSGIWSTESADNSGGATPRTDHVRDPDDNPAIAYQQSGFGLYAVRRNGVWALEPYAAIASGGGYRGLAYGSDKRPRIAHQDGTDIYYSERMGSSWETVLVDGVSNGFFGPALSVDGVQPRIAYRDATDDDLKFAWGTAPDPCACVPNWTLAATTGPSPRAGQAMAYDRVRGEVVLFGGADASGTRLSDTWVWDGATWTQRLPLNSPSARSNHGMVYDSKRGRVLLACGSTNTGISDELWSWDGLDWTQIVTTNQPGTVYSFGMAYDPGRDRVVIYGGNGTTGRTSRTWEYDGTDWTNPFAGSPPGTRSRHDMVYSDALGAVVMFGGQLTGNVADDALWLYDGTWTQLPDGAPTDRWNHRMAYSPECGLVYVLGGQSTSTTYDGEFWTYGASGWTQVTAPGPGPRAAGGIAWDGANSTLVAHGGMNGTVLGDTWIYGCDPTPCTEPPPDMVLWHPFDELAGSLANDIAGTNDGTWSGPIAPGAGTVDGGYTFSGGRVVVPSAASLQFDANTNLSIDAWIRLSSTLPGFDDIQPIVEKWTGFYLWMDGNGDYHLAFDTGSLNYIAIGTPEAKTTATIPYDTWIHVAVAVDKTDPNGGVFYLDGVPQVTDIFDPSTLAKTDYSNGFNLNIGASDLPLSAFQSTFYGQIDEVEIFDRAIDAQEVWRIYQAGAAGKCKPVPTDVAAGGGVPRANDVLSVRPNPFNPTVRVVVTLEVGGQARVSVYDVAGRLVRVLQNGPLVAGRHEIEWNGRNESGVDVASGAYMVRFEAEGANRATRITLLR